MYCRGLEGAAGAQRLRPGHLEFADRHLLIPGETADGAFHRRRLGDSDCGLRLVRPAILPAHRDGQVEADVEHSVVGVDGEVGFEILLRRVADSEEDLYPFSRLRLQADGVRGPDRLGAVEFGADRCGLSRGPRRAASEKTHEVHRVGQGVVVRSVEDPGVTDGQLTSPGIALVVGGGPRPATEAAHSLDPPEASGQQFRLQPVRSGIEDVLETDEGLPAGGVTGADHGVHVLDGTGGRFLDHHIAARFEDGSRHDAMQGDPGGHTDQVQSRALCGEQFPQAVVDGGARVAQRSQVFGERLVIDGGSHLSGMNGGARLDDPAEGISMMGGISSHADDGDPGNRGSAHAPRTLPSFSTRSNMASNSLVPSSSHSSERKPRTPASSVPVTVRGDT